MDHTTRLVHYSEIAEATYLDYIQDWEQTGERIIPWASRRDGRNFEQLQKQWAEDESEQVTARGFVPATLYFLVDEHGHALGAIHLRHRLNEKLLLHGGHIGYGVRPGARGRHLAGTMLRMLLASAQVRALGRVLLTCDDDNIASARTIEQCGGVLENKVDDDGTLERRYWIELPPAPEGGQ